MADRQGAVNKVAFFVTRDQVEALQALEAEGASVESVKRATWQALVKKRLVTLDSAPMLTPAGTAFNVVNRLLDPVNRPAGAEEGT